MESKKDKDTKKENKRSKTVVLRILLYVFIAAGLAMILYPVYTNFIASKDISEELAEWEEKKDTAEEAYQDSGSQAIEAEDTIDEAEEIDFEDDPSMDIGKEEYSADGSGLTAEDLFPMKIEIPKIELEYMVYEGTDRETLKKGAGHEPVTPLPGEEGRCTISGHRTTYGAPFNRADELEQGDLIYLESLDDRLYTYAVTGIEIVKPTDVWILEGTEKKELLLTACHPKYSAAERLVVVAELVEIFSFEIET
jgi:LPXTG-site transpeptidase (sortase) family protein